MSKNWLARRWVRFAALCCVLSLGLKIGWIEAKAVLAQHLLNQAWQKNINHPEQEQHKPWPWFDSVPVASLSLPDGKKQVILEGLSGQALAFAPGLAVLDTFGRQLPQSVQSDEHVMLIAAHNDTHFERLEYLQKGQILSIELANGQSRRYVMESRQIVDRDQPFIGVNLQPGDLLLSTCYPFSALSNGGNQRYLVLARPQSVSVSLIRSNVG